jgi:hypothetical protein
MPFDLFADLFSDQRMDAVPRFAIEVGKDVFGVEVFFEHQSAGRCAYFRSVGLVDALHPDHVFNRNDDRGADLAACKLQRRRRDLR